MAGIFLLVFAVFFESIGGGDARRAGQATREVHASAAQTRQMRVHLVALHRAARNHPGRRAQPLIVWAPQVLVNLRRAARANGLSLGKVSVGRFLTASGATDLAKSQEPAAGWRGITQIPISIRGTWTTLDGLRAWVSYGRSLDAPIRNLTLMGNSFTAKIEIYGD